MSITFQTEHSNKKKEEKMATERQYPVHYQVPVPVKHYLGLS